MIFILVFSLASCGNRNILLFLNWGEYIDETLLEAFEEKYNCTVYMDLCESNEIFYSKVRGGTTVYDVVCPSDYMIEKMKNEDMLSPIDFSNIPNIKNIDENAFTIISDVKEVRGEGFKEFIN